MNGDETGDGVEARGGECTDGADDATSVDIGTAMESADEPETASQSPEDDSTDSDDDSGRGADFDYKGLVTNAAHCICAGEIDYDAVVVPDDAGEHVTRDALVADIEDKVAAIQARRERSSPDTTEDTNPTTGVDWAALWQEFGFDTPDATGRLWISRTQLIGAVESSEQKLPGDPKALICTGVEDGPLHEREREGANGGAFAREYIHTEVNDEH